MTKLLVSDEETFAVLLAEKTGQLHQQERSHATSARAWNRRFIRLKA